MELTDEQWMVLGSLIPVKQPREDGKGRPRLTNRAVLNGILWVSFSLFKGGATPVMVTGQRGEEGVRVELGRPIAVAVEEEPNHPYRQLPIRPGEESGDQAGLGNLGIYHVPHGAAGVDADHHLRPVLSRAGLLTCSLSRSRVRALHRGDPVI
jgi:hypothetical protein